MNKPRISFIVKYPSSDLDGKYTGATIYVRGTCHTLEEIADELNFGVPSHVLQLVRRAFDTEHRVELLIAGTEYKFYRQPDDLPKHEEGTKLEQYQAEVARAIINEDDDSLDAVLPAYCKHRGKNDEPCPTGRHCKSHGLHCID